MEDWAKNHSIRGLIVNALCFFALRYMSSLVERANYLEVGLNGYITEFDDIVAREKNLKPLNKFEKWLLGPRIKYLRKIRQDAFQEACISVAGFDPSENWA